VKKKLGLDADNAQRWSERRTKHVVAFGETVEQIAKKRLGDEQFAGLIVTLNRAVISTGADRQPIIMPGTIVELPAPAEVKVYRANFAVGERPKRSALNRQVSLLPDSTKQVPYVVPEVDDGNYVVALSPACRMFVVTRGPFAAQFSVKLQTEILGTYVTIASYESILGKTKRLLYRCDGACRQMDIELPADVAREMAKRDFERNWQRYFDQYLIQTQTVMPALQPIPQ
jgi:hypothetical protein